MIKGAVVSECGLYRYFLSRVWNEAAPRTLFVMLNPSTADAEADDATIRKCVGLARHWGSGGISVVNLFSYRATDPNSLWRAAKEVVPLNGPDFEEHFDAALGDPMHKIVIAGWGAEIETPAAVRAGARPWADAVATRLCTLHASCLGRTKRGSPRHPLMVSYMTKLEPL